MKRLGPLRKIFEAGEVIFPTVDMSRNLAYQMTYGNKPKEAEMKIINLLVRKHNDVAFPERPTVVVCPTSNPDKMI